MEENLVNLEECSQICRACLGYKENMKSVYNVASIIMSCASVQIEYGDGLPNTICTTCLEQAKQAYDFRLQCEQSDNLLRKKCIGDELYSVKNEVITSLQNAINSQITIIETNFDTTNLNNSDNSDNVTSENVPLKLEFNNSPIVQSSQSNVVLENPEENFLITLKETSDDSKNAEINPTENKIDNIPELNTPEPELKSDSETSENFDNRSELTCKYCDIKFRSKVRLKKHEAKHKNGFKCHLCPKIYPTSRQLHNHLNIHSRRGSHLCQTCGKQFTLPENLARHQRIHLGYKPFKCEICGKNFTQSNELKSHMVTHSDEKEHLCSICGNTYSRIISLNIHMRRVHSLPPNVRPYVCTVCGRNFKDRRDLAQHEYIHKGERSHICKVCHKAFNRSSNLRVHERIHTGYRPHICPTCNRSFIQKHVLLTHMKTHTKNE